MRREEKEVGGIDETIEDEKEIPDRHDSGKGPLEETGTGVVHPDI